MKYIKEYAFSALAILMASCSSDSDTIEPEAQKTPVTSSGTMSFSASIESGETASKATRTSLSNTDNPYPIWSSGDQIKVLNTATSDAQLFSINSSDVGKRAANFTGNIKVETGNNANNKFYAFYAGNVGASEGAPTISMSGSNVTVSGTIPSTQSSTPGFHSDLHFMTACTTGSAFSFKNGMALMKVTISDNNYENFKICKIVFKSNNSADNIAGDFTATIGDNGTLSNYSVTNGSSQIVIDGGVGGLSTGTYYIAINPCAFSSGFTLSFIHSITGNYGVTNNQTVELSQYDRIKSTAFKVGASEIINLGTYTAKECAKEAYVDLGITRTDGKKVLFVSEKMAALQVVFNRLSSVGLADFCLSLMFAGAAGYKPKPAQLLGLLHIIEAPDVPHFCQDPGQDVFSDAFDLQQVLCVWDLPAFLMEVFLDLIEFCCKVKDLLYKASDRFFAAACSMLQTYAFRCKLHDVFCSTVTASPKLCFTPDLSQAVCT